MPAAGPAYRFPAFLCPLNRGTFFRCGARETLQRNLGLCEAYHYGRRGTTQEESTSSVSPSDAWCIHCSSRRLSGSTSDRHWHWLPYWRYIDQDRFLGALCPAFHSHGLVKSRKEIRRCWASPPLPVPLACWTPEPSSGDLRGPAQRRVPQVPRPAGALLQPVPQQREERAALPPAEPRRRVRGAGGWRWRRYSGWGICFGFSRAPAVKLRPGFAVQCATGLCRLVFFTADVACVRRCRRRRRFLRRRVPLGLRCAFAIKLRPSIAVQSACRLSRLIFFAAEMAHVLGRGLPKSHEAEQDRRRRDADKRKRPANNH